MRLACASTDSLALDYLHRPSALRSVGAEAVNLSFCAKKNRNALNLDIPILAQKERFELSRRLPDLHP